MVFGHIVRRYIDGVFRSVHYDKRKDLETVENMIVELEDVPENCVDIRRLRMDNREEYISAER